MADKNTVEVPGKKQGGNNKTLIIVLVVVGVLVVLPALAFGGFILFAGNLVNNSVKQTLGVEMQTNPDGSTTLKSKDGSSVSVGSQELPSGFPSDIPLYAGQLISSSQKSAGEGYTTWNVSADSKDSLSTVEKFFTGKLGDWTSSSQGESNGSKYFVYSKDGTDFTLTLDSSAVEGYNTSITYTVTKQ